MVKLSNDTYDEDRLREKEIRQTRSGVDGGVGACVVVEVVGSRGSEGGRGGGGGGGIVSC